MGQVWIKCLGIVRIEENGQIETYHPGDWCRVGKHQARKLISNKTAEIPNIRTRSSVLQLEGAGVVLKGGHPTTQSKLEQFFPGIDVVGRDEIELPFARTFFWDPSKPIRLEWIPIGFDRLTTGWQVASPIVSYTKLANSFGGEEERKLTKEVVHSLTVPIRDPDIVFIVRCPETRQLIDVWREERERGKNPYLQFLRAIYRVKPILCDLPPTWLEL